MDLSFYLFTIGLILIIGGGLYLGYTKFQLRKDNNFPKAKDKDHSIAFLIPARDESKVITSLLDSIANQSVAISMQDIYVIVEDKKDLTVSIAKEKGATIVYRRDLTKRRKGYALDDAIKYIKDHDKHYSLYFIMDADNVLDSNFIKAMLSSYDQGYDIGIGYRNCKNGNDSWVAACSTLTFSMINTLGNKNRKKRSSNMLISGTGFYIRGELIDSFKGYPFHTLTEDYELSLYATLHGLTTDYNEQAFFYDEQPTSFKTTLYQRSRWIRGFIDARKIYIPKMKEKLKKNPRNRGSLYDMLVGVKPYISMVIGVFLIILALVARWLFASPLKVLFVLGFFLLLVYFALALITLHMIAREKGRLNLTTWHTIVAVLLNPLFLASYVPCAIYSLFNKNIEWKKVDHNRSL